MPNVFGVQVGWSLPFVHVVKLNNKYILHNGYHRTYGSAVAGVKYVPCLLHDVQDEQSAGIAADGSTFPGATMWSANPPTMAHFAQARAFDVQIRSATRIIQINWSQHTMLDE
jgi:hypothetical protein